MSYRLTRKPSRFLPPCVPDDVRMADVHWFPTKEERALEWNRQQMEEALAEVKRIELEEQRDWLAQQNQRLAQIAVEIEEYKRLEMLEAEMQKREAWIEKCQAEAKVSTEKVLEFYQKQLDGGAYEKMVERAEMARRDMERDNARLERLALLKRGAVRGRRA
jgi:hypothetical protein